MYRKNKQMMKYRIVQSKCLTFSKSIIQGNKRCTMFNLNFQRHSLPLKTPPKNHTQKIILSKPRKKLPVPLDPYLWLLHQIPRRSHLRSQEFWRRIYWQRTLRSNTQQCQGSGQGRRRSQRCWCPHWCRAPRCPACGWSGGHFPEPPGSRPPADCHLVAAVCPCLSVSRDFLKKKSSL